MQKYADLCKMFHFYAFIEGNNRQKIAAKNRPVNFNEPGVF
jgi:hypothetical protein